MCALVDGRDSFDPRSAEAAGVELRQLLWVRCRSLDQSLRAADLVIQGGGFGFIALDLSDVAPETVRHVPLNAWFRFRRAVEDTATVLLVLEQESNAKTCASLVLQMKGNVARWSSAAGAGNAWRENFVRRVGECATPALSRLLDGADVRADGDDPCAHSVSRIIRRRKSFTECTGNFASSRRDDFDSGRAHWRGEPGICAGEWRRSH